MATFEWPADIKPRRVSFWYRWRVSESRSVFTGKRRFLKRQGERWISEIEVEAVGYRTGRIDALLYQLQGPLNLVALPDFRRLGPFGTNASHGAWVATLTLPDKWTDDTGFSDGTGWTVAGGQTPRISFGSPAGGNRIGTDGWKPGDIVMRTGDYVELLGRRRMLTEDAVADGTGAADLVFVPALEAAVPVFDAAGDPTPFTRENITTPMRLVSADDAENPTRAPVVSTYRLRFEEDV